MNIGCRYWVARAGSGAVSIFYPLTSIYDYRDYRQEIAKLTILSWREHNESGKWVGGVKNQAYEESS